MSNVIEIKKTQNYMLRHLVFLIKEQERMNKQHTSRSTEDLTTKMEQDISSFFERYYKNN